MQYIKNNAKLVIEIVSGDNSRELAFNFDGTIRGHRNDNPKYTITPLRLTITFQGVEGNKPCFSFVLDDGRYIGVAHDGTAVIANNMTVFSIREHPDVPGFLRPQEDYPEPHLLTNAYYHLTTVIEGETYPVHWIGSGEARGHFSGSVERVSFHLDFGECGKNFGRCPGSDVCRFDGSTFECVDLTQQQIDQSQATQNQVFFWVALTVIIIVILLLAWALMR